MARRRPGRRRSSKRTYRRDAHGRFASAGTVAAEDTKRKRKRRRRAAVAGSTVVAGAVVASQARPASRTRTAVQRRRIIRRHVARTAADHEHLASVRTRVFPTTAVTGKGFDADAAKQEGRRLTKGYRKRAKTVRKASRKSRRT
jgi:hypothetical protein